MQRGLATLFLFVLALPLVGWSDGPSNDVTKVVAACGKPRRDYTFPTNTGDVLGNVTGFVQLLVTI
jgi:hypothetical protein